MRGTLTMTGTREKEDVLAEAIRIDSRGDLVRCISQDEKLLHTGVW